ncbi:MAG: hypothetical protein HUJ71_01200 [Pseudobutyrivibrio sp.]|nr:hypothetical protein [Pseudobutyrivibrio sp.]
MKYLRAPILAELVKYEVGMGLEDGFERFVEIIVNDYVEHDNLVQIKHGNDIVCPYIKTRRGRNFIQEGDYIVIEEDGTKRVCGGDIVFSRYIAQDGPGKRIQYNVAHLRRDHFVIPKDYRFQLSRQGVGEESSNDEIRKAIIDISNWVYKEVSVPGDVVYDIYEEMKRRGVRLTNLNRTMYAAAEKYIETKG